MRISREQYYKNKNQITEADLSVKDRIQVKHFRKYLHLNAKFGESFLLQRSFWRKYLLGKETTS